MYTYSIKSAKIAKKLGGHVTATVSAAGAAQAATSVPVAALTGAIPSGTVLYFSATKIATLTAAAAAGATSLTVSALPVALVSGDAAIGSYGPRVTLAAVQMMSGIVRVRSAEGFGNDELKVVPSRKIAGSGQLRMLGLDQAAMAVVMGDTPVVTGSGATEVSNLGVDTGRLPHLGVLGMAEADGDGDEGDEMIFLPDVVATSDITIGSFEDGALQTVEFSYTAVKSGIYKIVNVIERNATGDYLLPPAGILAA